MNSVFIKKYDSSQEAVKSLGKNGNHIKEACDGQIRSSYGFIWSYNPPEESVEIKPIKRKVRIVVKPKESSPHESIEIKPIKRKVRIVVKPKKSSQG